MSPMPRLGGQDGHVFDDCGAEGETVGGTSKAGVPKNFGVLAKVY